MIILPPFVSRPFRMQIMAASDEKFQEALAHVSAVLAVLRRLPGQLWAGYFERIAASLTSGDVEASVRARDSVPYVGMGAFGDFLEAYPQLAPHWNAITRVIGVLAVLLFAVAATAHAATHSDMPKEILPLAPEPEFEPLDYSELPPNIQMVVKMSTKDVWDAFQRKYPGLRLDSIRPNVGGEYVIKSGGRYFRRVSIYLEDRTSTGPHGPCGQPAAMWFMTSGEIKAIYVNEPTCPV